MNDESTPKGAPEVIAATETMLSQPADNALEGSPLRRTPPRPTERFDRRRLLARRRIVFELDRLLGCGRYRAGSAR